MQETRRIMPYWKFEGHTEGVSGAIHLPGGQRIVTCSEDGSMRVWNLDSGEQIGDDLRDGESAVITIALSPDGKTVVCGSGDGATRLWDIDTGKFITKWTGHTSYVTSVCWSRDGARLVNGSFGGTVRVCNVESGETILGPIETGFGVWAVVYSPDESMIATGGYSEENERIKIWDAKTGKLITNLKGHRDRVYCLAWSGRTLISGSCDNSIRTWNTATWQQVAILTEHTDTVAAIAISPNNRILASASWDKTTRLWNLENGQPIGLPIQHADLVACMSFSTDGNLLTTGCLDNNVYTWNISAIVVGADLNDFQSNSNDGDESFLDSSRRRCLSPSLTGPHHVAGGLFSHGFTSLGRISSLFSGTHYNAHDTTP